MTTIKPAQRIDTPMQAYTAGAAALDLVKALQAALLRGQLPSEMAQALAEARSALVHLDTLLLANATHDSNQK